MTKVFFAVSPFVDEIEIMGIDGEAYSIKPGKVILLPKINAEVFEKNNWGKIIGIYKDPSLESNKLSDIYEDESDVESPIKTWAEYALKIELAKPNPDPNKVIELKMILAGKDPYKLRSTPSDHQSAPKSPTGLSRPIYNTAQPHNFGNSIKDDDNIDGFYEGERLRKVFDLYGLRLVTTLQAYRVAGLDELGIQDYAIVDYGYTRVEPHEEFVKLLKRLGYSDDVV